MRCILVGLPGAGKSTMARFLGNRLRVPFDDSDVAIERQLGCSIRAYFEQHGEAMFRDVESEVLDALTQRPGDWVLATGGGAVLRPLNREHLQSRGAVLYLHTRPEQLAQRLKHDTQRPLLQGGDALDKLRQLYAVRDPLYREVAHHVIEAGRQSLHPMMRQVLGHLQSDYPDWQPASVAPAHPTSPRDPQPRARSAS